MRKAEQSILPLRWYVPAARFGVGVGAALVARLGGRRGSWPRYASERLGEGGSVSSPTGRGVIPGLRCFWSRPRERENAHAKVFLELSKLNETTGRFMRPY